MLFKDIPIRKKLLRVVFLINGVVLLVTCFTFLIYEFYVFRKATTEKLSTIGKIIAVNSTAALAFDDHDAAREILQSLKTEQHITAAALYDKNGKLFARFPDTSAINNFPAAPGSMGYQFTQSSLQGFEPIKQDEKILGTLYLQSDIETMYDRFRLYIILMVVVILMSFVMAYGLSTILQRNIASPVLALAQTAKVISGQKDYSVRAVKFGDDELGSLTDAFNQMLDQIQAQNESLGEFNKTLEQKVSDRTLQLELLNKELEAFSYSISHDLRAPLRGIIGFTSMLDEKYGSNVGEEGKRIIDIIKNNTLKMGNLIDDQLTFSRMSRQDIIKTRIPTGSLVNELVKESSAANPKIEWNIQPLPDTYGDLNAMRQVWVNLLSNAVKYSRHQQQPVISIGTFIQKDQQVFFVKDNGVGFDLKYRDKLFKVFQRLHNTAEFEGTGVGLAIVEKIISKHGGTVWVEAEKNKGATFYFGLPVNETA